MKPLLPSRGLGKQVSDYLRKALAVPEGVESFSVHIAVNELVRVECVYLPQEQPEADKRTQGQIAAAARKAIKRNA